MTEAALFVDDEEYVLNAIARLFRDQAFPVLRATNARDALDLLRQEEVAVLVSDNRMPGMSGIELLSKAKQVSPDTMKILMTGHADLTTALDAINKSEVFRFIVKPWENDQLLHTVEDAMNRYKVIQSLRSADEATLLSLAQTIELKDPYTRGHCDRVAQYALMMADAFVVSEEVKRDIKYSCWLHDCGKIGVPEEILNFKGPLSEAQFEIIKNHPSWGADVARRAHLSDRIVNSILNHHEKHDGTGYPSGIRGDEIPLEAKILAITDVFDALTTERPYSQPYSTEAAVAIMTSLKGRSFDPEILDVFLPIASKVDTEQVETLEEKDLV